MRVAAAVLVDPAGRTLLVRPEGKAPKLFSGMWQFPAIEVSHDGATALSRRLMQGTNVRSKEWAMLPEIRHTVTFREITLAPFLIHVPRLPKIAQARTVLLSRLAQTLPAAEAGLAISNAARKIACAAARAVERV